MKHNVKINGQIKEIEFGSGILDINGKEIFEGDTIRYDNGCRIGKIVLFQGTFCVTREVDGKICLPSLLEVNAIFKDLEIVDDK